MILFRAFQAADSALIMANNFALVTALFPPQERGRAMGISGGTVSALGYTLGPVLGGLLTYAFGWRSNLYLSAVLAFVGLGAARYLLPAESFKGFIGAKRTFRFLRRDHFRSQYLFAFACAGNGTKRRPGGAPSPALSFLAEFLFLACLFGWNGARVFRFSIWRSSGSRHLRWETPPDGLALSP